MTEILENLRSLPQEPDSMAQFDVNYSSITHPVHPSWQNWQQIDGLHEIMSNTNHLPFKNELERSATIRFIWSLTNKLSKVRVAYESDSRALVGLTEGSHEYAQYASLVGNEHFGLSAIKFMGAAVTRRFVQSETVNPTHKIGFELGGVLQLGNWRSTDQLDTMARNITESAAHDKVVELKIRGEKDSGEKPRYRLERTQDMIHAIARRRRPIANVVHTIYVKGSGEQIIETALFKESSVLIPLLNLDARSRMIIVEDCNKNPESNKLKSRGVNDTDAALQGGVIFQQAIEGARKGELSQQAIPLGAQYVASYRRLVAK